MNKMVPPYILGETEWPDAITSGDLLFHIPIQLVYDTGMLNDITGNVVIIDGRTNISTGGKEFKLQYNASLDAANLALGELFWDAKTKTPKWIVHKELGTNYLGLGYLFQCVRGEPWSDLILFSTPRTSSTNPSIEQVCAYLQLTPGDIMQFNGQDFIFNGQTMRF